MELREKRAQARSLLEVIAVQCKVNTVKSLTQNYFYFKATHKIESRINVTIIN